MIQYHYQHFLVAKATLEIAGHGHRVSERVFRNQRTFWPCFTLQLVSKSKQRSSSRKDTFTHNDNLGICCLCLHGMLCVVSAGSWTVLIIRQVVGPASSIRAINYPAGWTTPGTGTVRASGQLYRQYRIQRASHLPVPRPRAPLILE